MHRAPLQLIALAGLAFASPALAQPTTPPADEVRAIVAEMLADAQTRSSLLAGDTAGHDGAFYLASPDDSFRLQLGGMIQARYALNFRDDANTLGTSPGDDFSTGFQMRRTRLEFSGHVAKDWVYYIEGDFEPDGGAFRMKDAYVAHNLAERWTVLFGQVKAAVLREENISAKYQLAVERSITNAAFSQGRSQAVALVYQDDTIQFIPVFSDGAGTENTDFGAAPPLQSDFAFTGRLNWKIAGDWNAFNDFTSMQGSKFAAMIGGAVHYQQSANSSVITDTDVDVLLYTIDAQIEGDGWNLFAAFIGRDIKLRAAGSDTTFDDFGVVVQGGVFLTKAD